MLPKVATHILHTTSRAAAAVQNQTHTIRNVFQLQHSSAPSSASGNLGPWNGPGSSHWGGNGTGAGSTKYNTGSRYNGYTVRIRIHDLPRLSTVLIVSDRTLPVP